jgi:anti-anti-sigma factor
VADDVRFDPAGPVFAILERSDARGVTRALARRDLDMAASPAARHELTDLLRTGAGADRVLVHLGVGCFVDLYGLRVLVDVDARLRRRGGELVVVGPPRSLLVMVEVTGLGAGLTVAPVAPGAPHAVRRARRSGGAPGVVPHRRAAREGQP